MHGYRKSSEVELVRRKRQRINKNTTKCCVTFCCKKKKKIAKHFRLKDLDQKSTRNQQRRVKTSSLASWSKWKKKSQILFRLLLQFLIEFPWNLEAREFFSPTNWQSSNLWFDRSNPSFFFPLSPPLPSSYTAEEKKVGSRLKVGAMETRHVSIKQSFDSITRPATHECRCLRQDLGRTWKKIRVSNRDLVELW